MSEDNEKSPPAIAPTPTPGSWYWKFNSTAGRYYLATGSIEDGTFQWVPQTEANMALQAAAPDLLAELKRLRNAIRYSVKLPQASTDALLSALIDKATTLKP